MATEPKQVRVYRHRDTVAVELKTPYLEPHTARQLAVALQIWATDIDTNKLQESTIGEWEWPPEKEEDDDT